MRETIEKLSQELEKYPSRRSKKVLRLVTPDLISKIESEIIKINSYLTNRCIMERSTYHPETGDEDQPLRDRVKYLIDLVSKLKSL